MTTKSEGTVSRRDAATGFLSALGIVALSSCVERGSEEGSSGAAFDITGTTVCWVDTIANLKTVAHPTSGTTDSKIAVLEGYAAAYDGGGGVFCWDSAAVSEDTGTLIRPTNVATTSPGRWRRLDATMVNAKWFGAKGDGSTNDAAALQATIDVALARSGTVYLPPGTYFTGTQTLTTAALAAGKLRIIGSGKRVSRITRTAGSATTTLDILLTGSSVVEISDLTIDGPTGLGFDNASVGVNWITGDTAHRLRLERISVTGTHDAAVQNSGGGRVELVDCDLEATDACVGMFAPAGTDGGGASLLARGGTWKTPNGDLSTQGSVGLYVHPHVPYTVDGVTFEKIGRYGIYQNGSATDARGPAVATGCRFIECEMAQTKGNGVSNFSGCVVKGTSSLLGSKLNGRVNITGCTFDRGGSIDYGAGAFSDVTVTGCQIIDTPMGVSGATGNRWSIRDTTITITDALTSWLGVSCVDGLADFDNVTFKDETSTLSYQTFVRMTVGAPVVKLKGCKFRDGRGTLSSGIYQAAGTLTIEDCEFVARTTEAIYVQAVMGPNVLDGENNRFLNGAYVFVQSGTQQRLVRRRALNPNTVASVTNVNSNTSEFSQYDTHVVTGTTTIASLTQPYAFVGVVRFVVATGASWALGTGGNIAPKTTSARTAGSVVELLWEPIAARWLEV